MDSQESEDRLKHSLRMIKLSLVGGSREVDFYPSLNVVTGEISTGKSTFVRLIRSFLGSVPSNLPEETERIRGLRGSVAIHGQIWDIYRPLTQLGTAPVEIARRATKNSNFEPETFRVPAAGADASYSRFLLDQLDIPAVSVPTARSTGTSEDPVTFTDWLGYCIVTGDEMDYEVFGHRETWRDRKRRIVFELNYGIYNPIAAGLNAELRRVDGQLERLDVEQSVMNRFLEGTPFESRDGLLSEIDNVTANLLEAEQAENDLSSQTIAAAAVSELRLSMLSLRERLDNVTIAAERTASQVRDLRDLEKQLNSQSARLTRAIVADEWLVDFDFVVCPRCGNDVDRERAHSPHCYLCLQEEQPGQSRDSLLAEQVRLQNQIDETRQVIIERERDEEDLYTATQGLQVEIAEMSSELDHRTASFVADRAEAIRARAAEVSRLKEELRNLHEYVEILEKVQDYESYRAQLEAERAQIMSKLEGTGLAESAAEENVGALEARILQYLTRLHIPPFSGILSVKINRRTYMPEISGRSFDELSSQGLKTLVNVAHALAHHTVSIDRNLPLPGFLVLDGISANAGHEGFDQDRVSDVYELLLEVAQVYRSELQIIAVDNDLPSTYADALISRRVLDLSHDNLLIGTVEELELENEREAGDEEGSPDS